MKHVFVFDQDKCSACSACMIGCMDQNDIDLAAGDKCYRQTFDNEVEMADGSVVTARVSGRAAAASADDIPLLKLGVATRQGAGQLSSVTTIQHINTRGGVAAGTCDRAGLLLSVPYTADYAFHRARN